MTAANTIFCSLLQTRIICMCGEAYTPRMACTTCAICAQQGSSKRFAFHRAS